MITMGLRRGVLNHDEDHSASLRATRYMSKKECHLCPFVVLVVQGKKLITQKTQACTRRGRVMELKIMALM